MILALIYVAHLIAFPAALSTPRWPDSYAGTSRPTYATMGENGAVAIIVDRRDKQNVNYVFVVRSDGTTTVLGSDSVPADELRRLPRPMPCRRDGCTFDNVALAYDGTPFVTLEHYFGGAHLGFDEAAFVWNGSWHVVLEGVPFENRRGYAAPDNLSIGAADTPSSFAINGDFAGEQPGFQLPPVAAARLSGGIASLGDGIALAMRGAYVAGVRVNPADSSRGPAAIRWRCDPNAGTPCVLNNLGPGIPYAVDSHGEVVGSDGSRMPPPATAFDDAGEPVLWRAGKALVLSTRFGAAYAISESGTIVGTAEPSCGDRCRGPMRGFIADARDERPRARLLDPLVQNLGRRHLIAAFGVADDGRILALVGRDRENAKLAILVPQ